MSEETNTNGATGGAPASAAAASGANASGASAPATASAPVAQPANGGNGSGKTYTQSELDARISETQLRWANEAKAKAEADEAKRKGEFEKLYNDLKPRADRADLLEATARTVLSEIVPEQYRELLPEGPVEAQLAWAQKARARGLFAPPTAVAPPPATAGHPTNPATVGAPVSGVSDIAPVYEDELMWVDARKLREDPKELARYKNALKTGVVKTR